MIGEPLRLVVIGTGYVGLVSGACFAEIGHHVTCIDNNREKVELLNGGGIPIYEPGLQELVTRQREACRIEFTTDLAKNIKNADAVFIAVGTPTGRVEGEADLQYVFAVAEELADIISDDTVIVTKSTVPVGTGDKIREIIASKRPDVSFHMTSNPEFLREGCAVMDFLEPDRVVVGVDSDKARAVMGRIYEPMTNQGVNILYTDIRTSELTKYAANAFLATKIAFINEMADMCEAVGGNIEDVANGMGMDHRIGRNYLSPGPGFGGSCFPKDTLALRKMGFDLDVALNVVNAVIDANDARKRAMAHKVIAALKGDIQGKTIALLGLAFKANTDDTRYSPALVVAEELRRAGASIQAYDPEASDQAKEVLGVDNITYVASLQDALKSADAAVIATEWDVFRALSPQEFREQLKHPVVVDLRNLYRPADMKEIGLEYYSIGRS